MMGVLVSHVGKLRVQVGKSNSHVKLAWTHQMAFRISQSHLRGKPEEQVRGEAFQKLLSLADAHGAWHGSHAMNMVRLHVEFMEADLVALRCLHQADGVKIFIVDLPKDLISILWTPFEGPKVDAIRMAIAEVVGLHCRSLQESSRYRKLV